MIVDSSLRLNGLIKQQEKDSNIRFDIGIKFGFACRKLFSQN